MSRVLRYGPTIYLAIMSIWWGFDFAFRRDLTGDYTYYLLAKPELIDDSMGALAFIAGLLMLGGLIAGREAVTRIGFVLAGMSYAVFSSGFFMHALLRSDTMISSASPGWTYGGLSLLLILVGTSQWEAENDPHR